ncbi:MAG: GNAT family N-acetyltransferase [Actinomycetes bacterium]
MRNPEQHDVGSRVSIRLRDLEYGLRDVLGTLETVNSVRRKNGELWNFQSSDIVAWRIVPNVISRAGTGAPFSLRIKELEEIAERTWPPRETVDVGGWRLRLSDGFTNRANSIRPTAPAPFGLTSGNFDDLEEMVENSIRRYQERGLTPTFHLALPTYQKLNDYLVERGWICSVESHVMVVDKVSVPTVPMAADMVVDVLESATPQWLAVQGDGRGAGIMNAFPAKYLALRGADSDEWLAVGRMSEDSDWAFLSRLFVRPEYRGYGLSKVLLAAIAEKCDATKIALQVDIKNSVAIGLYQTMNFRVHHNYRYLTWTEQ